LKKYDFWVIWQLLFHTENRQHLTGQLERLKQKIVLDM
jgi:hypothetical protein